MNMNQRANKWPVATVGIAVAAAAAVLFARVVWHGGWLAAVMGPVSLWWAGAGLLAALSAALSKPGGWPRDGRARYLASTAALGVGGWIGGASVPWGALAVLPAYALVERVIVTRALPPDADSVYVGMPVWLAYITSAELLGYVIGALGFGIAR